MHPCKFSLISFSDCNPHHIKAQSLSIQRISISLQSLPVSLAPPLIPGTHTSLLPRRGSLSVFLLLHRMFLRFVGV